MFWPEWERKYCVKADDEKLPKSKEACIEHGERIGADGHDLLDAAIYSGGAPSWLQEVPAVEILRKVWLQNFFHGQDGRVRWRTAEEGIPPFRNFLDSPIDPDYRYARKFTTSWVGYRVHLTEACYDEAPSILRTSGPAPATVADGEATPPHPRGARGKELLPGTQFVDTGYLDAELLFESKERYSVDLFSLTRPDHKWQAKEGNGFETAAFSLDWENGVAICPEGKKSINWNPAIDNSTTAW